MHMGMLFFGIVCQLVGALTIGNRWNYAPSLWFGVAFAAAGSIHMSNRIRFVEQSVAQFMSNRLKIRRYFQTHVTQEKNKRIQLHGVFQYSFFGHPVWITTSHVCILIVMLLLIAFAIAANRCMAKASEVPGSFQ